MDEHYWDWLDEQFAGLHALAREIAVERGVDLEASAKRTDLARPRAEPIEVREEPKPYARRYVRSSRLAPVKVTREQGLQVRSGAGDEVRWVH